jgi:hypothetical protein
MIHLSHARKRNLRLLVAASCAVAIAGCGQYRSEKVATAPPPPPPSTATTTATTPVPKVKPHPGWPKLVNCLTGRGFKARKAKATQFTVTTATGTDSTDVLVFPSAAAARKYAGSLKLLNDRVGRLVASYGTTAGPVRDGIKACASAP